MSNKYGKVVMLKPRNPVERFVRAWYSDTRARWFASFHPETLINIASILRNGQGWQKKRERISAKLHLGSDIDRWSDQNLRRLGMRKVVCQCAPGIGHNDRRR
jgi:hypothetical protein